MRIGRLEFGKATGKSSWGYHKGSCKCRMLDLGRFYITLLDKNCKCNACKQYTCECEEYDDCS